MRLGGIANQCDLEDLTQDAFLGLLESHGPQADYHLEALIRFAFWRGTKSLRTKAQAKPLPWTPNKVVQTPEAEVCVRDLFHKLEDGIDQWFPTPAKRKRQKRVLHLLAQGHGVTEIAKIIKVSRTVGKRLTLETRAACAATLGLNTMRYSKSLGRKGAKFMKEAL